MTTTARIVPTTAAGTGWWVTRDFESRPLFRAEQTAAPQRARGPQGP